MAKSVKGSKMTSAVSTQSAKDLTSLTANDIPALLKTVTDKINELKGGIPKESKTTGDLPGFGKIKEITTVESLIQAHSMVVNKERVYNESAAALGVEIKKYPFKIGGSLAAEWVVDIMGTINVVKNKVELEKLTKIKATLESNLSAKAKLARDLKEINDMINE
jgi:hypothetical protein